MAAPENPSVSAPLPLSATDAVTVEPAALPGFGYAFGGGYHFRMAILTSLGFLGGVILVEVFGYTFWVFLEGFRRAVGGEAGESLFLAFLNRFVPPLSGLFGGRGWTLDAAIIFGLLAAWAAMHLYFDRAAMHGNRAGQEKLLRKARSLIQPLSVTRHFVEVRRTTVDLPLPPDTGWLLFYPDRLVFVGDEHRATFPRLQVRGNPRIRRGPGGLGAHRVELELAPPYGLLYLLPREDARRLLDTAQNAHALYDALAAWLTETHAPLSADR
jgi:hypothetical protein